MASLRGAGRLFAGEWTNWKVAGDIDVRDTDAMMIVYALVPALAMGREHDPYFTYLFPDVHDRLDLPELDEERVVPDRPSSADVDSWAEMGASNRLSSDAAIIVDTNVFFAIGRPSNPKYQRFRQAIREAGVVLKLPERVVDELGGPETERIQRALDEGWAELIDAPSPQDSDAVRASDIARRTIDNETDRAEHEVEKTDAILAGLTLQYLQDTESSAVIVVTDDRPAKIGIETAIRELGYEDAVAVYDEVEEVWIDLQEWRTIRRRFREVERARRSREGTTATPPKRWELMLRQRWNDESSHRMTGDEYATR